MEGTYSRIGEPTEAALKVLVEKLGIPGKSAKSIDPFLMACEANTYWEQQYEKLAVLEFNRDRKSMSTLCKLKPEFRPKNQKEVVQNRLFVKGAAEVLIQRCSKMKLEDGSIIQIDAEIRERLIAQSSDMSRRPLRCLALAYSEGVDLAGDLNSIASADDASRAKILQDPSKFVDIEKDLILVGLCGIKDPARPEAADAILLCRKAGIRVMMITGDSKETAVAIAKDVNIFEKSATLAQLTSIPNSMLQGAVPETAPQASVTAFDHAFTGQEFFSLSEDVQLNVLRRGNKVFCRTEPR